MTFKIPKKLIEVALPLDDINEAAAREKSIRHGHPSTLHLWWARRPLATARAVIFAQMVNDPGYERSLQRGVNKKEAEQKREALFQIIRDLVKWENTNNETVLAKARAAIWDSWRETCELNKNHPQAAELFNPEKLPAFHDPFAGGGALPLEAQRLGLESYASDLNPVAVMINKAMIEIPPKFAGRAPVGALPEGNLQTKLPEQWTGAQGLAEDVRRYGHWMREQAFERIGHLYPQVDITTGLPVFPKTSVLGELVEPQTANTATVIAWLWARTVKSPNPAFSHVDVPLISTFILSSKAGKEAYIEPIIDGDSYRFEVRMGKPPASAKTGTKLARGSNFQCLLSESPIDAKYIRAEAQSGRMGVRLMAIVAEGVRGRIYLAPTDNQQEIALQAKPTWKPDLLVTTPCHDIDRLPMYGMYTWGDAFTLRQLLALTTFSDLIQEARGKVFADAIAHGMIDDGLGLAEGGMGATAYADAVAVYHLASCAYPASELNGVPTLLDKAEVLELPNAKVAVIDGINFSVSKPKQHDDLSCYTLWGELAWQLGGLEGYALVKSADESGTSPDKDTLIKLLSQAAPCVILMDELVAFYRQFDEGKKHSAGSFETNMTFIQALSEAIKSVPKAILLASLPDSHNAGEGRGQVVLRELEAYFRRLHKIWKPVSKDEAFSIVRRRLFENIDDVQTVNQVCHAFADYYCLHKLELPSDTQESRYIERMQQAYPIHPEIFDRLYEDWSTLEGFQKTRGVLQLMAQLIYRLWKNGNADLMIMPANLPLDDTAVRNKCLDFLPQGWDAVIDQDIDGEHSRPAELDKQPLFGKIQAGRRLTRTLFLGSAPASAGKMTKGLALEHILLGVAQPEQVLGHYKDALKLLLDKLNYINHEDKRYWFDITPNLRREMESRKHRFKDKEAIVPLLKTELNQIIGKTAFFAGVHVFSESADIPDDYGTGPRLVVLSLAAAYSNGAANTAFVKAEEILKKRGEQPRLKQNRLLFLAADYDSVSRLRDLSKTYLAWSSIVEDINNESLVLDIIQVKQAKKQKEDANRAVKQMLHNTYKWLISPSAKADNSTNIIWEAVPISSAASNLILEVENKLKEEDWVTVQWSPVHLLGVVTT